MTILYINGIPSSNEVNSLLIRDKRNSLSLGDIIVSSNKGVLDIYCISYNSQGNFNLSNFKHVFHDTHSDYHLDRSCIIFSYDQKHPSLGDKRALQLLQTVTGIDIFNKYLSNAEDILNHVQERFDAKTMMDFVLFCNNLGAPVADKQVPVGKAPVASQPALAEGEISKDDAIDAHYCFWGPFTWENEQIKLAKSIGMREIRPEHVIIVDYKNRQLHLCDFIHDAGEYSYLYVLESYDVEGNLTELLNKYTLKHYKIYSFQENICLSKKNINNQIFDIVKNHTSLERVHTDTTTIVDTIQSVYDFLLDKGVPKSNIANSIFTLFPQILEDKEIFPKRLHVIRDVQHRLIDLNSENINFNKDFACVVLSEQERNVFRMAVDYYIHIKHFSKIMALSATCSDLGFSETRRKKVVEHFSKANCIADLKDELLTFICKRTEKSLQQDLKEEKTIKPIPKVDRPIKQVPLQLNQNEQKEVQRISAPTAETENVAINIPLINNGLICELSKEDQKHKIYTDVPFKFSEVESRRRRIIRHINEKVIIIYISLEEAHRIIITHSDSTYDVFRGEGEDCRFPQELHDNRYRLTSNGYVIEGNDRILLMVKRSEEDCVFFDEVKCQGYDMKTDSHKNNQQAILFHFRSLLRFKD